MRRKDTTAEMMKGYMVDSLLKLMEEKSYGEITAAEIAARAGVNRSSYYRHFACKEDVVECYFERLHTEFRGIAEATKRTIALREYILGGFKFLLLHKREMLMLYGSGVMLPLLEVLNRHYCISPDTFCLLEERYLSAGRIGGVFNQILYWFSRDMRDEPGVATDTVMSLMPDEAEEKVMVEAPAASAEN